jgi:hypothetical protein
LLHRSLGVLAAVATALLTIASVSAADINTSGVMPQRLDVAGSFSFDPVLFKGQFIIGQQDCVAVGTRTTRLSIDHCYIVADDGEIFEAPPSTGTNNVAETVQVLRHVPAVNLTHCITASADFKDGTSQTVHLASAPSGEPVQACPLG